MRSRPQRSLRRAIAGLSLFTFLLFVSAGGPSAGEAAAELPRGVVVPELETRSSPHRRYAIYLPSRWSEEREWPVLIVLDPRGRAVAAAELFAAGAEEQGWIVLSSYDSRSDTPPGENPNSPALEALLAEAARHAADLRRVYLAGFSGTSKFAWSAGRLMGGLLAGVIGCGGALPGAWDDWKDVSFAYFGAAGTFDFNHRSMRELEERLAETDVAHRFEYFTGGHQWLGAELAADALGWMDLQAMKRGLRQRDLVVIERLYERWLAAARAAEAEGDLFGTWRAYDNLVSDFAGLRPTAAAVAERDRLAARPEVGAAQRELARVLDGERRYRERLGAVMRNIAYQAEPKSLAKLLAELEIEALRQEAEGDSLGAQAARRKLELVRVQAAFYIPRVLLASGAPRRAALALEIAAAVRPEDVETRFQLARVLALAGETERALAALEHAVDNGFVDRERLRDDTAFTDLRDTRQFKRLLARVR